MKFLSYWQIWLFFGLLIAFFVAIAIMQSQQGNPERPNVSSECLEVRAKYLGTYEGFPGPSGFINYVEFKNKEILCIYSYTTKEKWLKIKEGTFYQVDYQLSPNKCEVVSIGAQCNRGQQ